MSTIKSKHRKIKDELGNIWIIENEYEGFSKQDLKDRYDALSRECFELAFEQFNISQEMLIIKALLNDL